MDRQSLINKCRYYKGESESPFAGNQDKAMFWSYEKKWVDMSLNSSDDELLSGFVKEYNAYGLFDFERKDGVPKTLKALLFNRFYHWEGISLTNTTPFKDWYLNNYKGNL